MTIEQTIEIPADRRVFFEFLAPREIPAGKARIELKVTPVIEKQDKFKPASINEQATPISDSLLGILSNLGDISLDEIRTERLSKYLK